MSGKTRIGDKAAGTCVHSSSPFNWTGTVITGAASVLTNNAGDARLGDKVFTNCPSCPVCNLVQGSDVTISESAGSARIGDQVTGPSSAIGKIITSSDDVLTG